MSKDLFEEAQKIAIKNDPTAKAIQKCVQKIYYKIARAAKRGKYGITISSYPRIIRKSSLEQCQYVELIMDHFKAAKFSVTYPCTGCSQYMHISWKPNEHTKMFKIVGGDKLKHLVLTGTAPLIAVENPFKQIRQE